MKWVRIINSEEINGQTSLAKGYRLILKLCSSRRITNLTVPILLSPKPKEALALPVILKRSEMVFKQTRGALTEYASGSGEQKDTRHIIFLVADTAGTAEEFDGIRNVLSSVFKVS